MGELVSSISLLCLDKEKNSTCIGSSAIIGLGTVGGNEAPLHKMARTDCIDSLTCKKITMLLA